MSNPVLAGGRVNLQDFLEQVLVVGEGIPYLGDVNFSSPGPVPCFRSNVRLPVNNTESH